MTNSKTPICLALILAAGIAGSAPQSISASNEIELAVCLPEDCAPELLETDIETESKIYKEQQEKIEKGLDELEKNNLQLKSLRKLIG